MSVKKGSKAILLLSIGSPESPKVRDVANYLSQFLINRRVVELPFLLRTFVVYFCIVPFRVFKVTKRYKRLADLYEQEFPINKYGLSIEKQLNQQVDLEDSEVFWGTCYGKHNLRKSLEIIKEKGFEKLILLPLFPQYAKSSSGVVAEEALMCLRKLNFRPAIRIIRSFDTHPDFIQVWAEKIKTFHPENYDVVLFSYHSLPSKQAEESKRGKYDYEKACIETTQRISQQINIPSHQVETVFQSQMSSAWLDPFLDVRLFEKAKQGTKKILVVMPGFVSDCLETVVEIEQYRKSFLQAGGEELTLVDSLNNNPMWINALKGVILYFTRCNFVS